MGLDIAILDSNGSPKEQITIGVEDHYRLLQLIRGKTDSLLSRISDYYGDAEFENGELHDLIKEALILRAQCRQGDQLYLFLNALVELTEMAKSKQKPLVVIAD